MTCSVCDSNDYCYDECTVCSKLICQDCEFSCDECGVYICGACAKNCECGDYVCLNCFEDSSCPNEG